MIYNTNSIVEEKPLNNIYLYKKDIKPLLFIVFSLFTFGFKIFLFYFNWITCIVVSLFLATVLTAKFQMKKIYLNQFMMVSVWVILPLIFTFTDFVYNTAKHMLTMSLALLYSISSIFILNYFLRKKTNYLRIMFFLNYIWVILTFISIPLFIFKIPPLTRRSFAGIFHNRINFAIVSVFLLSNLLFLKNLIPKKKKTLSYFFILCNGLFIISSLSLTGLTSLILIISMKLFQIKKIIIKIGIILIIFIFIVFLFFTDNLLRYRISRFIMITNSYEALNVRESAYGRISLYLQGIKLFLKHPLTGVGVGNASFFIKLPHTLNDPDAQGAFSHSTHLEMLLNGGIGTYLLYYAPIYFLLFQLMFTKKYKKRKYYSLLLFLILFKLQIDLTWMTYNFFGLSFMHASIFWIYYNMVKTKNTGYTIDNTISDT